MSKDKRLDIGDLSGDPWADAARRARKSNAPAEGDLEPLRKRLRDSIEGFGTGDEGFAPAHAQLAELVTSEPPLADAFPEAEWPDPEYFGEPGPGLAPNQKQFLYERGERELGELTRQDFKKARKQAKRMEKAWAEFQTRYPEEAKDQASVQAAVSDALAAGYSYSDDDFVDVVGGYFYTRPQSRTSSADNDASRTQGIVGGRSGGSATPSRESEREKPGDLVSELQTIQRKTGYY